MELAAAVVAVVEVTSRASSALWKLGEEWKNAPRDIYQLRDDVDRAVSLYRVVQASIAPPENPKGGDGYRAQVVRGGGDNGGGPGEALVADELKLLVLEGESAVSRIQAMIDNLMHTSGTPFAAADIIPKMRRLAWLRNQAKVRYLQSVLRRNLDQLGMHLVLLNL
jgi:hypothetical protein